MAYARGRMMSSRAPEGWLRGRKLTWTPPDTVWLWYLPNNLDGHMSCNDNTDYDDDDDDDDAEEEDDDNAAADHDDGYAENVVMMIKTIMAGFNIYQIIAMMMAGR